MSADVPEDGSPVGLSRVELEPWMARAAVHGHTATVDEIGTELAGRVWQWFNPYAETWGPP